MNIKLIIFDIGGVLFESTNHHEEAIAEMAGRYGVSDDEVEDAIYKHFEDYHFNRVMSQYRYWKRVLSELGVSDEDLEKEFEYVYDLFNHKVKSKENEKMAELVEKLAKKSYKLAVLSHSTKDDNIRIFNSNFIKYIDRICLSHLNSYKKNEKEAFKDILDAFGVKPKQTLFIDDKKKNLVAPEKLGINTILYNYEKHEEFLEELSEYELF